MAFDSHPPPPETSPRVGSFPGRPAFRSFKRPSGPGAAAIATDGSDPGGSFPQASFRVFGHGIVNTVLPYLERAGIILSGTEKLPPEIHVLSFLTDEVDVRLHEDRLDLSVLMGMTQEGYEIFQPMDRLRFPAPVAELRRVLSLLQAEVFLERDSYGHTGLLNLFGSHPSLACVNVEQVRHRFRIGEAACEFGQVSFDGIPFETVCVQCENYKTMGSVIDCLGLRGLPNTSCAKAAKRLAKAFGAHPGLLPACHPPLDHPGR